MSIPTEYKGRYFYHFTHIDNIESIINSGGLLSTNMKRMQKITHHNIANMDIQNRRSMMEVTVCPGGVVHDYVPFYFGSISPMLLGLLNRKVVDQPYICFFAVSIEKILNDNVIFTNASANTIEPPEFYDQPEDLENLNWELIDLRKWSEDSEEDKHFRMAEVLVRDSVPLEWISAIIVFDKTAKKRIEKSYRSAKIKTPQIYIKWFANNPFYFLKFFFEGRKNETAILGPQQLYELFLECITYINKKRLCISHENSLFRDIGDALYQIGQDFCVLRELEGIYELVTDNEMHSDTVSGHTIKVVEQLNNSWFFEQLDTEKQNIVNFQRICMILERDQRVNGKMESKRPIQIIQQMDYVC